MEFEAPEPTGDEEETLTQIDSQMTLMRTARIVQDAAKNCPEFLDWLLSGLRSDIASVDDRWYREAVDMEVVNQLRGQKSMAVDILRRIEMELNRDLAVETRKLEVFQQVGGQK